MSEELTTASVLAFERKLDPSDAVLHAGRCQDIEKASAWSPIAIREKSVRGTISNRLKAKEQDPAKLDAAVENANLQTVDFAALPADADTLKVQFTLRVLAGAGMPSACNSARYRVKLQGVVDAYVAQHGFTELANRYAGNLANGRFLWRNRLGAETVRVDVSRQQDGKATWGRSFDALSRELHAIDTVDSDVAELGGLIADGLTGRAHVLLHVTAYVRLGLGQEVFPSQELILDKGGSRKSKTLYHVENVAAIHSQKIGNAVRTIDTWYEGAGELGPIAVEPYGSVTTQGKAYRPPRKQDKADPAFRPQDFYTLLDDWLLRDKTPTVEQQHFVMAVLIRGGVFGDGS
ncbi:type I-F CRISPR-associated protein Csy3 [Caballeronia concitans]|uniref:CRISPR-associated protein Csy3 n=1 Tax=Caballeronia concitans TaxID=1777133 RepID=A0A658R231_9BURK|nr:type I-F CRISPR-associated protein Csy3 [Caballeronia concitans]KIG08620.1 CRISPR-associated protein, Csy3 family [Burkholderia sp. MR1]SAL40391.1 CRISPR-associated protein Csy3 [Caballeronia concitans]